MNSNSIFLINPKRYNGTWVFTDNSVGLVNEPFVAGIPEVIDSYVPQEYNSFNLYFSSSPFPGYSTYLSKKENESGGAWYVDNKTSQRGWLCPALLKYFSTPPEELYVKVSNFS